MRTLYEVIELDRDCELGKRSERAVVATIDGAYMTLVFANRAPADRVVRTGTDYRFVRSV